MKISGYFFRRIILWAGVLLLGLWPAAGKAALTQEFFAAQTLCIAVGTSAAAYDDRIGRLARDYLERNGWTIERYVQEKGHDGARFVLAKKTGPEDSIIYVLAFVGTETPGDLRFDFKVDKVYFAGQTIEDFLANAKKRDVPNTEPKVHRGFQEFLQSALQAKTVGADGKALLLKDVLLNNPQHKIYLTGHSLGGAVATLAGAGMLEIGVRPQQVEVITFGAPAVGNEAFAAKFEPLLPLTRVVISGDPVTGVIQGLVGGYRQFGRELRWTLREQGDQSHRIVEYMDLALKHYYTVLKRQEAADYRVPPQSRGQQVYVAPLQGRLPDGIKKELPYMRDVVREEYWQRFPGCWLHEDNEEGETNWRRSAAAAGCRWLVVPAVSAVMLKQEENVYYITFMQTVYEVESGNIVDLGSYSTGTYNLTPLEALLNDLRGSSMEENLWQLRSKI